MQQLNSGQITCGVELGLLLVEVCAYLDKFRESFTLFMILLTVCKTLVSSLLCSRPIAPYLTCPCVTRHVVQQFLHSAFLMLNPPPMPMLCKGRRASPKYNLCRSTRFVLGCWVEVFYTV